MNVEVIDDTHQKFNGVVYHKDSRGYYLRSYRRLHRDVWEYYNGEIPAGYDIHHVDGNPANNDISNLQMLTHSDHNLIHVADRLKVKSNFICTNCGKVYAAARSGNNRFCSARCTQNYYYHRREYVKVCEYCGNEFHTHHKNTRFCSRHCSNQFVYKDSIVEKICPICGKPFKTTKAADVKTCSHLCGQRFRRQKQKRN